MDPQNFVTLELGTLFHGRYRVIRRIKAGAMGAVYEVADEVTDRRRALKVMLAGAIESRARFAQEAKITGAVESDHIVRISDAGVDAESGRPFLVMDLLLGEDLGTRSARRGALPPTEVVLYLAQIALALDRTHAAGVVHRDLKPENLFLTTRDDGSPCVKILDFGVAKLTSPSALADRTAIVGTPLYMAPEQIRGDGTVGPAADTYALGHLAYALLVGAPYWMKEAHATPSLYLLFNKMVAKLPEPPSARAARRRVTLPPAFDAWFQQATAPEGKDRFERATTAVTQLAEALGVSAGAATMAALPLSPARHSDRPPASRSDPVASSRRPSSPAEPPLNDEKHLLAALEREFLAARDGDGKLSVLVFALHDVGRIEKGRGPAGVARALQGLARAVQIYVRPGATVARYGIDGIALLLPGTGRTAAIAGEKVLGERVRKQLAKDTKAATVQIRVTAAYLEKGDASGLDLLVRAARAL